MKLRTLTIVAAAAALPLSVFAADHGDISSAGMEPTADITDIYAWMTDDASMLNLVMGVNSNAGPNAVFSNALAYVFHIDSMQAYGEPQADTPIVCKFADASTIECWGAGDYAVGDPSNPAGLMSQNGVFRVFAGLRNDPFFLEYQGFLAAEGAAFDAAGAGQVAFDTEGCAQLTPEQSAALVGQLGSGPNNVPPTDTFAGQNVLALVIQVNKAAVATNGPILGIWGATHMVQ